MTRKKVLVMLGAIVLAVGIALAGIWYNAAAAAGLSGCPGPRR